ncbi:hypothetical protein QFZ76_000265 [Streptomyces sp. V4I2]|nr:hypothetical protein [Streptomyces sp. V4I2]
MSKHLFLRKAVLSWLEYAGGLSPTPQSIVVLMLQPHWEDVVREVAAAAPSASFLKGRTHIGGVSAVWAVRVCPRSKVGRGR